MLADAGDPEIMLPVKRIGLPDGKFVDHGSVSDLRQLVRIDEAMGDAAYAHGDLPAAIEHHERAIAADHVLDLSAGEERSIAATKTYTAELAAIALRNARAEDALRSERDFAKNLVDTAQVIILAVPVSSGKPMARCAWESFSVSLAA